MTKAKSRIWARLIHKGDKSIDDVPKADRDTVRAAYFDIYGEELE